MKGKIDGILKVVGVTAALALGTTSAFAADGFGGHVSGGHIGGGVHFSARSAGPARLSGGVRAYAPRAGVRGYAYGGWRGAAYGYRPYWGGGYWGGAFWPRAYYGWSYPLFLAALPALYATYWWDSVPYYYVNDVYYTYDAADSGYVATDPPPVAGPDELGAVEAAGEGAPPPADESQGAPPPAAGATAPGEIMAYPRNGQSEQQQATDKYQCHTWARTQSGFDPTDQASASEPAANQAAYQRAMAACLDARGYSTR